MNFRIERIHDRWDTRLTAFRMSLCCELGAGIDYLDQDMSYQQTMAHFASSPAEEREELWKFGHRKWLQTTFDALECVIADGKIVSISGCRHYADGMMRVAMHLYTLKSHRKDVRNIQFCENGFFSRHLEFARLNGSVVCLFMSIYPHSRKLESHAKNLATRRISPDGGAMKYIHDLVFIPKPLLFHGVEQYFYLYPLAPHFQFSGEAPRCLEPTLRDSVVT